VSGFSRNCFRKIEARAIVQITMTPSNDSARAARQLTPPGRLAHIARYRYGLHPLRPVQKKKSFGGRRNRLKRPDSDEEIQENPSEFL